VTISNINDPQCWRKRAQEMRVIAQEMTVLARAKESVLRIADQYERRALWAERRLHQDSGLASAAVTSEPSEADLCVPTRRAGEY
jgi:hypothetical protein